MKGHLVIGFKKEEYAKFVKVLREANLLWNGAYPMSIRADYHLLEGIPLEKFESAGKKIGWSISNMLKLLSSFDFEDIVYFFRIEPIYDDDIALRRLAIQELGKFLEQGDIIIAHSTQHALAADFFLELDYARVFSFDQHLDANSSSGELTVSFGNGVFMAHKGLPHEKFSFIGYDLRGPKEMGMNLRGHQIIEMSGRDASFVPFVGDYGEFENLAKSGWKSPERITKLAEIEGDYNEFIRRAEAEIDKAKKGTKVIVDVDVDVFEEYKQGKKGGVLKYRDFVGLMKRLEHEKANVRAILFSEIGARISKATNAELMEKCILPTCKLFLQKKVAIPRDTRP